MFHPDNFGELTVEMVLQALEQGQKFSRQDAHMNELGVATLTSCFVNANRDPKKGQAAKPSDFFYFAQTDTLNPAIANAFFSLIKDELLPPWVAYSAPVDLLRQSKTNGCHSPHKRMLVGEGVAIFCPEISEQRIVSDFGVYHEAAWGWMWLKDVDSGKEYEVFIIPPEYEQQYCRDLVLERR